MHAEKTKFYILQYIQYLGTNIYVKFMFSILILLEREIYLIIVLGVAIIVTFLMILHKRGKDKIDIVNITASTSFADHLDLGKVGLALEGFERKKGYFKAFTYRLKYPKVSVFIFKSGKANCSGARDLADISWACKKISLAFKKIGIESYDNPSIVIQNVMAVYNIKKDLNLPHIAMILGLENVEYSPWEFPDLVYRIEEPKVSMMLFSSGKIVCTGAKNEADIEIGIKILKKTLRNADLI